MKYLSQEEYKKYHENLIKQGYFVETKPVLPKKDAPWGKSREFLKESPELYSFLKGFNG